MFPQDPGQLAVFRELLKLHLFICMCVCACVCSPVPWTALGSCFLLLLHGSPGCNSCLQAWPHTPLLSHVSRALALLAPGFPNKWSLDGQFLSSTLRIPWNIVEHSLGCVCVSGEGCRGEEIHPGYLVGEGGVGAALKG